MENYKMQVIEQARQIVSGNKEALDKLCTCSTNKIDEAYKEALLIVEKKTKIKGVRND